MKIRCSSTSSKLLVKDGEGSPGLIKRFALSAIAAVLIGTSINVTAESMRGRIASERGGSALEGASISLRDSSGNQINKAVANNKGEFLFNQLKPGTYQIDVKYLGFVTRTFDVVIVEGENYSGQFKLSGGVNYEQGKNVLIVTSDVNSQTKSLNQEASSNALISVASSDDIGQFPDRNVAEALQRVPGVTIRTETGEGGFAVIRGAQPLLNTVNINGQKLASTRTGGRDNKLSSLPVENIERIEVLKVFTPDLAGDFIGGTVNIVSKSAFGYDGTRAQFSLKAGESDIREEEYYDFASAVSTKLLDDKLGVVLSLDYSDRPTGTERVSTNWGQELASTSDLLPRELLIQNLDIESEKLGATINAEYRPTNDSTYHLKMSSQSLDQQKTFQQSYIGFGYDNGLSGLDADDGSNSDNGSFSIATVLRGAAELNREIDLLTFQLGGTNHFDTISIDYELANSEADIETDQLIAQLQNPFASQPVLGGHLYTDFSTNSPHVGLDPAIDAVTNDIANYTNLSRLESAEQVGNEEELSFKFNLKLDSDLFGYPSVYKTGFVVSKKDKVTSVNIDSYNAAPVASIGSVVPGFAIPWLNDGADFDSSIVDGQYSFGPALDIHGVRQLFLDNKDTFDAALRSDLISNFLTNARNFKATEKVSAIYGMATTEIDDTSVIAGVRVEQFTTDYTARAFDAITNSFVDLTTDKDQTVILPSIVTKTEIDSGVILRTSATKTYARPSFEQLSPAENKDNIQGFTFHTGNPNLEPMESVNLDISLDYYTEPLGVVGLAIFYKDISDQIVNQHTAFVDPLTGATLEKIQPINNSGTANLLGLELNFQQPLSIIAEELSNFSLIANYTYIDSDFDIEDQNRRTALPFTSDQAMNLSLSFEKNDFKVRFAYTYQSEYLRDASREGAQMDRWIGERGTYDLTAQWAVTRNWGLYAEWFNITDEPFTEYRGNASRMINNEYTGTSVGIGIRGTF